MERFETSSRSKRLSTVPLSWLALFLSGGLWFSCLADPWPEPDEAAPSRESGGEANQYDEDSKAGADGDTDGAADLGSDTGTAQADDTDLDSGVYTDSESGTQGVSELFYCSASGPDAMVTVVGLAGAVIAAKEVIIRNGSEAVVATVGADGGFARQVRALPGDTLEVVVQVEGAETVIELTVADTLADYVEAAVGGLGLAIDTVGANAIIHGDGEALAIGDLLIGANRTQSTGRAAVVSCVDTACTFDLLLPGRSGDEIDLFLVAAEEQSGRTDVQTIIVP